MPTRRDLLKFALTLPAAEIFSSALPAHADAQEPSQEKAVASGTVMFADFEGGTWDGWKVEGDAFGPAPATDALFPGKMKGFSGKGFVCTFTPEKGYAATGKATSKEFTIEKPFITFKIGGGKFPGKACLNLVVEGETVRTETGDGTGRFVDASWDVAELVGKKAHFEIVDATDSQQRGYVLVDDVRLDSRDSYDPLLMEILDKGRDQYKLPGIWCAIISQGKIISSAVSGKKNQNGSPCDIDDKLKIGSVSKLFTNLLIARLADQGLLRFSDSFSKFYPEYSDNSATTASIQQFMMHQSGMPRTPSGRFIPVKSETHESYRKRMLELYLKTTPIGLPGSQTVYSGAGCIFLSHIIEKISGKSWEKIMRDEVFDLLKMKNAGFGEPLLSDRNQPWPYSMRGADTELKPWTWDEIAFSQWDYIQGMRYIDPAGAIHCSIKDLLYFANAWVGSSKYLSKRTSGTMIVEATDGDYTSGGWVRHFRGEWRRHEGCTGTGDGTTLMVLPNRKIAYAYWINADRGFGGGISTPEIDSAVQKYALSVTINSPYAVGV